MMRMLGFAHLTEHIEGLEVLPPEIFLFQKFPGFRMREIAEGSSNDRG